jgi:hypothetical protein
MGGFLLRCLQAVPVIATMHSSLFGTSAFLAPLRKLLLVLANSDLATLLTNAPGADHTGEGV